MNVSDAKGPEGGRRFPPIFKYFSDVPVVKNGIAGFQNLKMKYCSIQRDYEGKTYALRQTKLLRLYRNLSRHVNHSKISRNASPFMRFSNGSLKKFRRNWLNSQVRRRQHFLLPREYSLPQSMR